MSFFDSMRRFFGADSDYNNDDTHDNDLTTADDDDDTTTADARAAEESAAPAVDGLVELPARPVVDPAMKSKIFEGVVAIFNESLPDFLRKSVDPERQSELIMQSLDASLSQYLDDLSAQAAVYAEARLKNAADNARHEAERLRHDMESLEQQRTSLREQQLSAERRRRALADRVQDLETQLANADAEREQFELEKKSLLNKLKVTEVQPGVIEELQQEIERLKSEHTDTPETAPDPAQLEVLNAEIEKINTELAEARTALAEAHAAIEQHKANAENSQTMYNDLQHQLVDEREARAKAEAESAEARKIFETVKEMQLQMQQVEVLIQKRDDRIARLKSINKKLKEELAETKARLAETEDMHDDGLFALVQEDEEPELVPSAEEEAAMASLEDDFECPEWFTQPAPGEGRLKVSEEPFGYTPPVRKPAPDNDAQLSLF